MCEGIGVLRRSWEGVMNEGAGQSEWSCNFDENEKAKNVRSDASLISSKV